MRQVLKQRLRKGFTLLEFLIAMGIASFISVMLFTALRQFSTLSGSVVYLTDVSSKDFLVYKLLQQDLAGIFVPVITEEQQTDTTGAGQQQPEQQSQPGQQAQPPQQPQQPGQQQPGQPGQQAPVKTLERPVKEAFVAKNKEKNIEFLTYITSNPLQAYGKPKPSIMRIAYKLEKEAGKKDSFILLRQESESLDGSAEKPVGGVSAPRWYEVINNIKGLTMSFVMTFTKDKGQKERKTFSEWPPPEIAEQEKKKGTVSLPETVQVMLALWDNPHKRSKDISFTLETSEGLQRVYSFDLTGYLKKRDDQKKGQQQKGTTP